MLAGWKTYLQAESHKPLQHARTGEHAMLPLSLEASHAGGRSVSNMEGLLGLMFANPVVVSTYDCNWSK